MKKRLNWRNIVAWVLLVTLILSIIYSVVHIIISPAENTGVEYEKLKSDYVLMLTQCILGLIVMFIPSIIERRWAIDIPNYMEILYFVFLYCAIYLGEVRNFYYVIPHWDLILHAFSGGMLGALGFTLVSILNESSKIQMKLSPVFVAVFSFSFALAVGTLWEIYEFVFDGVLSLNMQKFALEDGTLLIGREALSDTMEDLIVDALSALIVVIIGYLTIMKKKVKIIKDDAENDFS
ncbi:MAG: hypothetical protein GX957_02925 [Clostridiaceae bacterium]|nr:hypothetical protein [Clostridiaceae bacterium]